MRPVLVLLLLLLAGCSEAPGLAQWDQEGPLYGGDLYHLGPEQPDFSDVDVLVGDCRDGGTAKAYTINTTSRDQPRTSSIQIERYGDAPNATRFLVIAFVEGPDGLHPARVARGGPERALDQYFTTFHIGDGWMPYMPETLHVPVGADGLARVLIACDGGGSVNYVVGELEQLEEGWMAPHYLPAANASGFEVFAAAAASVGGGISIPPGTAPAFTLLSGATGGASITVPDEVAPGLRRGDTTISWTAPSAGWTSLHCRHFAWEDQGFYRYEADLHGDARRDEGLASYTAIGLSQTFLHGTLVFDHAAEGDTPADLTFAIEHQALGDIGWRTACNGMHVEGTLTQLFGRPAYNAWFQMDGILGDP